MRSLIFAVFLAAVPNEASSKLAQQNQGYGLDSYEYPINMLVCVNFRSAEIAQSHLYGLAPEVREQYFKFLDWHHLCRRQIVNSRWAIVQACRAKVDKKKCDIRPLVYPDQSEWYGIFLPE